MKNPKLIKLYAIKAELTTDQKGWSRMQAVRGLFNKRVRAARHPQDDIRVSTSPGVTGRLTHASLEMRRQTFALASACRLRPAERHGAGKRAYARKLRRQNAPVPRQGWRHQGGSTSKRPPVRHRVRHRSSSLTLRPHSRKGGARSSEAAPIMSMTSRRNLRDSPRRRGNRVLRGLARRRLRRRP